MYRGFSHYYLSTSLDNFYTVLLYKKLLADSKSEKDNMNIILKKLEKERERGYTKIIQIGSRIYMQLHVTLIFVTLHHTSTFHFY